VVWGAGGTFTTKERAMYQHIDIVGNLGRDPEMRFTPDGTPVCNFTVAVNRRWTGADGTPAEKTTWFRVTAWRRLAEVCNQYLTKGRQVLVVGEIDTSAWTDQEGKARASLELTAQTVKFLGAGTGENGNGGANSPEDSGEENIPF
jgi:single-strand DNA-binding protein